MTKSTKTAIFKKPRSTKSSFFRENIKYYLIVTGVSGTGKTALIQTLSGENPYIPHDERTNHPTRHQLFSDTLAFELIDMPGQEWHESIRIEELDRLKREHRENHMSIGVINVVSNGYLEGPIGNYVIDPVVDDKVNHEYLKQARRTEMLQIPEWTKRLFDDPPIADWLLTVVSKADLWWAPRAWRDIKFSYGNPKSDYFKLIGRNAQRFHRVIPFSAINHLFYDTVPMTGYYSDEQKEHDFISLQETIVQLASKTLELLKRGNHG